VTGVGHSQTVLSGGAGLQGTLTLASNDASSTADLDVWGAAGTTQTVLATGAGSTTLFGGQSDLAFTGGRSTLILNGSTTGATTVNSTSDNTVWGGNGGLTFDEGAGSDNVYLTGSASNATIFGDVSGASGRTTVNDLRVGSGDVTLVGGDKAQILNITATNATVFGNVGAQTISQNGSGNLTVADGQTNGGPQTITVSANATGSLAYFGGTNAADITLGKSSAFISAGSGDTTLTGGSGVLTLDLADTSKVTLNVNGAMSGNVDVFGFKPSTAALNVSDALSQTVSSTPPV
jgi:hypothetical protein